MRLPVLLALLAGLVGCGSLSYQTYDPRPRTLPRADVAAEVAELVDDLAARAELRTPLGSVRVVVDDLVPLEPRARRYRQATLERQAIRDIQATLRNELEISLADRMNVVGGTVISGSVHGSLEDRASKSEASHAIVGTFQRDGSDVELVVQLVELRSDWLVAAARRRIERFEPDAFATPVLAQDRGRATASVESAATDPGGARSPAVPEPTSTITLADPAFDASGVRAAAGSTGDGSARIVEAGGAADGQAMSLELMESIPDDIVFAEGPAAARLRAIDPALVDGDKAGNAALEEPATPLPGAKLPD